MLIKSDVLIRLTQNSHLVVSMQHSDKMPPQVGDYVSGQAEIGGDSITQSGIVVKVLQ